MTSLLPFRPSQSREYAPIATDEAAYDAAAATVKTVVASRGRLQCHLRKHRSWRFSGCGCLGQCVALYAGAVLASSVYCLLVSPLTLRTAVQSVKADEHVCNSGRWPRNEHPPLTQDWCCKTFAKGCPASYIKWDRFMKFQQEMFFIAVGLPLAAICISTLLRKPIHSCIRAVDQKVLGVTVDYRTVDVEACWGTVRVDGVTLGNPEGYETGKNMMTVELIIADFDTVASLCSCGKRVVLERLTVQGAHVVVDIGVVAKHIAVAATSVVTAIKQALLHTGGPGGAKEHSNVEALKAAMKREDGKDDSEFSSTEVIIRQVSFRESRVGFRVGTTEGDLALPDWRLNFEEMGSTRPDEVIRELTTHLLEKAQQAVLGHLGMAGPCDEEE